MLWFQQAESHAATNLHTSVVSIVQHWISIVKAKPHPIVNLSCVAFDSYYSSADSLNLCIQEAAPFMASVKLNNHQASQLVQTGVNTPGESQMAYSETTNELVVHHFSLDENIGRKTVATNVMRRLAPLARTRNTYTTPAYDEYKHMFSLCDLFNRNLHDRGWPLRSGGRGGSLLSLRCSTISRSHAFYRTHLVPSWQ